MAPVPQGRGRRGDQHAEHQRHGLPNAGTSGRWRCRSAPSPRARRERSAPGRAASPAKAAARRRRHRQQDRTTGAARGYGVTHDGALLTLAEMTSPYRQTHISLYGHPQRFFSAARPATAVLCWLSLPAPPPHETPDQYRRARPGARHRLLRTGFRADADAPPGAGGGGNVRRPGPIYLLEKAAGTPAAGARQPRDYARHWTPVHLDVVVDDVDAAVARAVAAGARLEPGRHACLGPHRPPERLRPALDAGAPGGGRRGRGRGAGRRPAPGSKTRPPRMPGAASPT